jgi:hypothetical protein
VQLTLDHVILRAADPAAALEELARRTGAPVLVPAHEAGAFTSGILRASVDVEVLAIGADPPPEVVGYGLGFTADVPLEQASTQLRVAGYKTSPEVVATADGRTWAAVQVHGLLPDPFPVPTFRKAHSTKQRATEMLTLAIARVPPVARALTRRAGSSMVVVTEYRFDAARWRAGAGPAPTVTAVEVGTAGHDWSQLTLAPGPLVLDPEGPPGVRRIVFGDGAELRFG